MTKADKHHRESQPSENVKMFRCTTDSVPSRCDDLSQNSAANAHCALVNVSNNSVSVTQLKGIKFTIARKRLSAVVKQAMRSVL